MDDHTIREVSDDGSEAESTGFDGEGWLDAAGDVWYAWLAGATAVLVAGYFYFTEGVWPTTAETFYVLIFAAVAVAALGYGVYEVRSRTSPP